MTSTEDTQITELEIIRKYLFDRYDKLVVDVNNPSILKEDCDACDKRINIIDLIKKHSNPNDTGHLRELNYKYKKNILFIEPSDYFDLFNKPSHPNDGFRILNDKYKKEIVFIDPDDHLYDPGYFRILNDKYNKNLLFFKYGKKTYYDNIIFPEYIKNIYNNKSNIYNKNFIDELLDAIYKEKIEDKKLEKEKKLQKKQNAETQKELHKLKKQNAETQKELQKLKKQNTETQDKKQKLQKQTITKSKPDNNKKKKKPISATIKRLVWNTNIGEQIGKAKCMCCNVTDMTQMSFNCGHIIAESNGGETIVSNLKPICQNCNSSMGTKNMEEFIKTLK
jgi:5-methylcytosine-specific restriction endonuclease McrA